MEVEKDKIKDLFSSKLGSFEPEVPASVWGGLDQLLSNQPIPQADTSSSSSSSTGASGSTSLMKTVAIIVGLAVAVAAGVFFLNTNNEKEIIESLKIEEVKEILTDTIPVEEKDSVYEVSVVSFKQPAVREQQPKEDKIVVSEEEIEVLDTEEEEQEEKIKEETEEIVVKTETVAELPIVKLEKEDKGVSIGIVANMGLLSYEDKGEGADFLFSRRVRSKEFIEALNIEGSEIMMKHKRPISLGLTIGKELSSKISIETGLIYSYLSSEIISESYFLLSETQKFSYVGVPLSLRYTFGKLGNAKFYGSMGGMIQKDIKGEYISRLGLAKPEGQKPNEDLYYKEPYYIKKSIKQSNPQFSLRTTLGVIHPLYKKLYIYGAIGGTYYFDSNNKYRTIYSDEKIQLNLDLGIKYDF